ncbi:hypothetical protein [Bradyrhizobium zhanjiangense]|uniref:hypothetical protein n=1 Tax=Bradyrhizobium zhanjiangense TaxID=1325107 RepID=UPI0010089E30|nr:hypothetical protein [Bradyrhizobium zhanjiangense]
MRLHFLVIQRPDRHQQAEFGRTEMSPPAVVARPFIVAIEDDGGGQTGGESQQCAEGKRRIVSHRSGKEANVGRNSEYRHKACFTHVVDFEAAMGFPVLAFFESGLAQEQDLRRGTD